MKPVVVVAGLLAAAALVTCEGNFDPCTGVTCSGRGTCVALEDRAICDCVAGYHDEGLECVESTADGDADSDADVPDCGASCSGRACGPDGCGGACPPGCALGEDCVEGRCEATPACRPNAGFGAPCEGVDLCDDGSLCLDVGTGGAMGICSPSCSGGEACADVAPGTEQCLTWMIPVIGNHCLVLCGSAADCPCGLRCVDDLHIGYAVCHT